MESGRPLAPSRCPGPERPPGALVGVQWPSQSVLLGEVLGEGYDLICGRAFLHHIPERRDVLARIRDALRPGGFVLVEEPDFHSVFAEENLAMRAFWEGFVAWSANQSIDYFVGRRLGLWLAELGFEAVDLRGETILSEGGSAISAFWKLTFEELSGPILASGMVAQKDFDEAMRLFDTPGHWNWQCTFLIAAGQKPAS